MKFTWQKYDSCDALKLTNVQIILFDAEKLHNSKFSDKASIHIQNNTTLHYNIFSKNLWGKLLVNQVAIEWMTILLMSAKWSNGGTMPEDLPTPSKSIQQIEKQQLMELDIKKDY